MQAKMRIQVRLFMKLLPGYAFFILTLVLIELLYTLIAGRNIGIMSLFLAFIFLRYTYKYQITYHNHSTKKCIALSIILFLISSFPLIVLHIGISLLSFVPIAIGMTWFLYILGQNEQYKELIKPKPFDLDNCTVEELTARCKERFKRDVEYKTERAIKHFILKLPHEQIDVNPQQSKIERYRFRKILK